MATTVYDIAREAGVSRTTVLRALWDRGDINPKTKARIKAIAAKMNYRPNYVARSLVTGKSRLVGVVASPVAVSLFSNTIEPIERILREAEYSIVFYSTSNDSASMQATAELLIQNQVAGAIIIPNSNPESLKYYRELVNAGVKLVLLSRIIEDLEVPQVSGDEYEVARIQTEHLISLGHRRIAHLAIPTTSYAGRERARAFKDAMAAAGIPVTKESIIEVGFDENSGERAMAEILRRKELPTAVMTRHDIVAVGVIRAILAEGLLVPRDISVVGNGNLWFSDVLHAPLTTVKHPDEETSMLAARILVDLLNGEEVSNEKHILPVELVIRQSTASPRTIRA